MNNQKLAAAVKYSHISAPPVSLPENSCDCHHHIYDRRFPWAPDDKRNLPDATTYDYLQFKHWLGFRRHVLVQPSSYGTDNRCLVEALGRFGQVARGEAVVIDRIGDPELDALGAAGVTGVRFNFGAGSATTPAMLLPLANRMAERGWHIQVHATADRLWERRDLLLQVPVYLVHDRGMTILKAGFVASLPALCGCAGALLGGILSDFMLSRGFTLSAARKTPIVIGMLLAVNMVICNYIDSAWIVVAIMSLAFFGKGFGAMGWCVVSDFSPKEAVGLSGGLFNMIGNISGIFTPIIIAWIIKDTGSFNGALIFVGVCAFLNLCCYLFVAGKIQRLSFEASQQPANNNFPGEPHVSQR